MDGRGSKRRVQSERILQVRRLREGDGRICDCSFLWGGKTCCGRMYVGDESSLSNSGGLNTKALLYEGSECYYVKWVP